MNRTVAILLQFVKLTKMELECIAHEDLTTAERNILERIKRLESHLNTRVIKQ